MEQSKPRLTTDAFLSEHVFDQANDRKPGADQCTGVCHIRRLRSVMIYVHGEEKLNVGKFAGNRPVSASFMILYHVVVSFEPQQRAGAEEYRTSTTSLSRSKTSIDPVYSQDNSQSVTMLAQRSTQQMLRRLAVSKPSMISQLAMKGMTAPALIASSRQIRPVTTERMAAADSLQILAAQRRNRPTSPHLSIYKPQITWYLSMLNRITGATLSGGMYLFGMAYLIAPLTGWHLESASMVAAFATWPVAMKVATKFAVALPFTYHSFNGIRHLIWDTGRQFNNQTVIRTGWTVVGVSTVSALYLATMV